MYRYPALHSVAVVAMLACTASCHAWQFRCRFVERVGNMDVVLPGNSLYIYPFEPPHNMRLQFGVFDDADGPAPAGGFLGWNVGTLAVSGTVNNSDDRRNPGRLAPFNFASGTNANGNPPLPAGDPFTMLTEIDNTLGTQSLIWTCVPDGSGGSMPGPMPQPIIRGLNTFVSVYAFSIQLNTFSTGYTITAGGNLYAARDWRTIGTPTPPECPDSGSVTYLPFPEMPRTFSCVLAVNTPPPASAAIVFLGAAGGAMSRRRRGV